MVKEGLFEETEKLFHEWGRECRALNTIGYREVVRGFIEKNESREKVVERIKQNTRKYA